MTEPHVGCSKDQIAQAVLDTELDTTPTNAVVIDAVARFCHQENYADEPIVAVHQ